MLSRPASFPLPLPLIIASISLVLLQACHQNSDSQNKEAWDKNNDPKIFEKSRGNTLIPYSAKIQDLPLSGTLARMPWSDSYWFTNQGGLSYRWRTSSLRAADAFDYNILETIPVAIEQTTHLSPMEKFDLYIGNTNFRYTKAERFRTQVLKIIPDNPAFDPTYSIAGWEGLCHAWSHASLAFEEPGPVTIKNKSGLDIEFGSADVKGLLAYMFDKVDFKKVNMLGARCEENLNALILENQAGQLPDEDYQRRANTGACSDTNPASFHIVLTNEIGRRKEGFVFDMSRDKEVWNHPIYGYTTEIIDENPVTPQAAPGTVKELYVQTTVKYVAGTTATWDEAAPKLEEVQYRYFLEIDAQDRIIGGHWITSERPDFMWRRSTPEFRGDFKAIEEIYQASIKAKHQKAEASRANKP